MRKLLLLPAIPAAIALSAIGAAGRTPSVPPPTPVPPKGSPSPFPTVLATPTPSLHRPPVSSSAAILEDVDTGQVLYARRPDEPRAIASLTKIMTALVVLHRAGPRDMVTVSAEAARLGSENVGLSELGLKEGEHLTVGQLLYAMMLQSANDAAVALADHVSASTDAFIALMNREAARDGFTHTKFYSPNGLDDRGYSSARSLAAMTRLAEQDPEFGRIVRTKFHVVPPPPGGEPRHIQNRNVLLWLYPGATGVKTGFTTKSEYCLVATAELHGARFVAVVLGDPTSSASFGDAASLLNYGFDAFVRRPIVSKGGALPPIRFRHLQYPLQAAAPLEAWVPAASVDQPSVTIDIRPLQNSPRVDSRVGEATFSLHGQVLGRVPVSVSGPPRIAPPPAASHRVVTLPWWRRGVDTMNRAAGGLFHAIFG